MGLSAHVAGLLVQAQANVAADRCLADPYEVSARQVNEALTPTDREEVERIVRAELKGTKNEAYLLKIIQNVLSSLFKGLYTRRSCWRDGLSTRND